MPFGLCPQCPQCGTSINNQDALIVVAKKPSDLRVVSVDPVAHLAHLKTLPFYSQVALSGSAVVLDSRHHI